MKKILKDYSLVLLCLMLFVSCKKAEITAVSSPNGINNITFLNDENSDEITFLVKYGEQVVIQSSILKLLSNEIDFSGDLSILKTEISSENNEWQSNFAELSRITDHYNQIKIFLKLGEAQVNIIGRAYNEGVAFAYEIPEQQNIEEIGLAENIHYNFKEDYNVWATPKRGPGVLTAQGEYKKLPLSKLEKGCERPLVMEIHDSLKIALAEAKLVDYARLSFDKGTSSKYSILSSLDGKMGKQEQDTISGAIISKRVEVGAKVHKKLPFQSPWRVVMMAKNEGELLENNYLIQNLNDPSAIADESWIKPGKVLRETTLTTQGAYAAIDFVAEHNMQYIMFDAGWYGDEMKNSSDATTVTLDPKRSKGPLDMEAVTAYGKEKGIGLILYINRRALEKQIEEVLPLLKKWGVAGIKYGFVRVGDQDATAWMHEAVKKTAQYEMIIDVHDEYRPTGFSRTYPNFLTQEGIRGDEESVPNAHTLISMFTRTLAGASDNTVCYYNSRVSKMGSHASQLAKTVCIFSPLQFLYWYDKAPLAPVKEDVLWGDTKTIGNEPELEFFDNVPTTWDETKVLEAEIGKIGVIARRKGNDWYIGGINGETARNVVLDFSFLDENQSYRAKVYTDDETIETRTHVKIEAIEVSNKSKLNLNVKSNNGFAMRITKL
ncbi:glycoside hydrolase family 97 N-terminal domain-containing protein [Algibacter miyuki]|uniref:Glycoside hydrolase family 97 N-terminal domain-containing protein n=1 Tax=Algibacter miyuki TaxID=1306933 RepID=A0ABV5GZK0_9FLAO|nr:glycoside hydrolase family 97 protein [Algibacter miyuki]MDN3666733.1 glycoside hydrolase family 97 N-terminal domain-containing protein [Algibacter miyuki]